MGQYTVGMLSMVFKLAKGAENHRRSMRFRTDRKDHHPTFSSKTDRVHESKC